MLTTSTKEGRTLCFIVQDVHDPVYVAQTMTLNPQRAMLSQHRLSIASSFEDLLIAVNFESATAPNFIQKP